MRQPVSTFPILLFAAFFIPNAAPVSAAPTTCNTERCHSLLAIFSARSDNFSKFKKGEWRGWGVISVQEYRVFSGTAPLEGLNCFVADKMMEPTGSIYACSTAKLSADAAKRLAANLRSDMESLQPGMKWFQLNDKEKLVYGDLAWVFGSSKERGIAAITFDEPQPPIIPFAVLRVGVASQSLPMFNLISSLGACNNKGC